MYISFKIFWCCTKSALEIRSAPSTGRHFSAPSNMNGAAHGAVRPVRPVYVSVCSEVQNGTERNALRAEFKIFKFQNAKLRNSESQPTVLALTKM